jgi:hypothetical protein
MAAGALCISQLFGDGLWVAFSTNATVLRQNVTPDALRGREAGTVHLLTGGLGLIAALAAGFVADWIGIRVVLWTGSLGILASSLWLLALPQNVDQR